MSISSGAFKLVRPLHVLGVLFATSLGGIFLGSVISRLLAQYLLGISGEEWQVMLSALPPHMTPLEQHAMLLMLSIQTLTTFLLPAYFTARYAFGSPFAHYFVPIARPIPTIGLTIALCLCAIALNSLLIEWNAHWRVPSYLIEFEEWSRMQETRIQHLTYALLRTDHTGRVLINLLVFAALPAIAEEYFFRGVLQRGIQAILNQTHTAILISALLFSLMHLQFYSFLPRLFLGILFGYLFLTSGNLLIPIIAHFVNNAYAVISLHLTQNPDIITQTPKAIPWYALVIALMCGAWIAKQLLKIHPIPKK